MKLFDYSIKIKISLIVAFLVLIVALIFLINYNNSHSRDLDRVTQARGLATGLELYFDKYNVYPEFSKANLSDIKLITENGINQSGGYLYFAANNNMDGLFISNTERYIIEFGLDNAWNLWGLDSSSGGVCRIINNLKMTCQSNK